MFNQSISRNNLAPTVKANANTDNDLKTLITDEFERLKLIIQKGKNDDILESSTSDNLKQFFTDDINRKNNDNVKKSFDLYSNLKNIIIDNNNKLVNLEFKLNDIEIKLTEIQSKSKTSAPPNSPRQSTPLISPRSTAPVPFARKTSSSSLNRPLINKVKSK